jgi:ketosteroid isomerase-like protein
MTQQNIDVVLASIDAYNAEDFDAQMETYASDAVVVPVSDFPRTTPIVGREALREWVEHEASDWHARYQPSEVCPLGADCVLCRGEWGGIGVTSGIEAYQSMSVLFALRDGVISRAEFYRDHAEALKAAGLEE